MNPSADCACRKHHPPMLTETQTRPSGAVQPKRLLPKESLVQETTVVCKHGRSEI